MTAIETLLAGLFDYAGLYPPASLGVRAAANNYLEYCQGAHASALGRFIINAERLVELEATAGAALERFRLSVIVSEMAGVDAVADAMNRGMRIETIETKCGGAEQMIEMKGRIPKGVAVYFELPVTDSGRAALGSIASAGVRAKIRMGGVVPEAFPSTGEVARMLGMLAELRLPFKATAGLHHPVRGPRALTYEPASPRGTMHGFMNLCCAASVLCFGGSASDAHALLEEEDASAWRVGSDGIEWRDLKWTTDELATVRRDFLHSIGSCSFEEPMHDLESLGWL